MSNHRNEESDVAVETAHINISIGLDTHGEHTFYSDIGGDLTFTEAFGVLELVKANLIQLWHEEGT